MQPAPHKGSKAASAKREGSPVKQQRSISQEVRRICVPLLPAAPDRPRVPAHPSLPMCARRSQTTPMARIPGMTRSGPRARSGLWTTAFAWRYASPRARPHIPILTPRYPGHLAHSPVEHSQGVNSAPLQPDSAAKRSCSWLAPVVHICPVGQGHSCECRASPVCACCAVLSYRTR